MKHILIIEDERAVAELERDYLEINSFKVSIEETGEGGIQRSLKVDIELNIKDMSHKHISETTTHFSS